MATRLAVLRQENQVSRFTRLQMDDGRTAIPEGHARALAEDLRGRIDGEVRFDEGSRALYATDASNYRQVPIGVVIPRHAGDVETTLELARRHGAPILSRGGGTSLAGQCCNVAVVMDFSKYMHRVVAMDVGRRLGTVEPGCVLDGLREAAKRAGGLTFGPDPATHDHCTLGGMLGNNSCGVHSLMSKNNGLGLRTSDNLHEMEVLTYRGHRMRVGPTDPAALDRIIRDGGTRGAIYSSLKALVDRYGDVIRQKYPKLERRVSGYNLPELLPENGFNVARALVGSESTLVTILEATLCLIPEPPARTLVILGYPDIFEAADHIGEILPFNPTGLEGMDHLLFHYVKQKGDENANLALLPEGRGFLLVEFGGESKDESDAQARRMMDAVRRKSGDRPPSMKLYDDPEQEEMIWKVREGSLGSTAWVPGLPDTWPGWEDSAVPVHHVATYLRDLKKLFHKYDFNPSVYGHLGQGCIHCRVPFDLYTNDGLKKWRSFMEEATDLVKRLGGSYSGEHGDGQARGEFLPKLFGPELMEAMREFKRIWDPDNRMNPGKVINLDGPPYRMDENLRIGPDYNPPQPETYFAYPADRHSFARAALRCVGVGKCRREGGGTMCPSYMVTREEKHSTRGRARLLFEMMNGEVIDDGWRSEAVREALDLCLACKGCKGDCPVNVDMATYKAEFLAHHYARRLRPRHAYAFGWIHYWASLAGMAPSVANLFTQLPGLSMLAKWVAGVDQRRRIPGFAPESFKNWFRRHRPKNPDGPLVALFADTFNNYFHVETAKAAVEVLEDAGFRVTVPMKDVCCGRPLYDYGFLGMARRWLRDTLRKLRPIIRADVPIVVLEPSCWAVFKDELTNLLPNDLDAQRLQNNTYLFGAFMREKAPHYRAPQLHRKAVVHGHCHHKSLDRLHDKQYGELFNEKAVLKEMGVEFEMPEDGCCGMAGAFGFEAGEHYDVSVACGERVLVPTVENADEEKVVVADGFSCREQISQMTGREALHMAQVLQQAIRHGPGGPPGSPETELIRARESAKVRGMAGAGALLIAGAVLGAWLYDTRRRPATGTKGRLTT